MANQLMEQRKRLEITEAMLEQIQQVTGTSVSASDIVVYEAAALSTRPLHKPGSIYHGARPTREMLLDMARGVRSGAHSVPLHTLHQQGEELPVGRVFDGDIAEEEDGSTTLLARFYLPAAEKDLVGKIDLAVLDEVSVGVKSTQALCSSCGFDFFGDDAGIEHLWDQTCAEGHVIGQDGMHLTLSGLDAWMELSLVSRGASNKPKIRSRIKDVMPQATYDRLAASGRPVEAMMLFTQPPLEKPMDAETKALLEGLSAKVDAIEARLSAEPEPVQASVELTEAEILDLSIGDLKIADLQVRAAAADELQVQLDAANARVAELTAEPAPAPAPAPAQIETPVLPVGGVAASAITDAKDEIRVLSASAFKTLKTNRR